MAKKQQQSNSHSIVLNGQTGNDKTWGTAFQYGNNSSFLNRSICWSEKIPDGKRDTERKRREKERERQCLKIKWKPERAGNRLQQHSFIIEWTIDKNVAKVRYRILTRPFPFFQSIFISIDSLLSAWFFIFFSRTRSFTCLLWPRIACSFVRFVPQWMNRYFQSSLCTHMYIYQFVSELLFQRFVRIDRCIHK